jgi:phosphate/sulfate permease
VAPGGWIASLVGAVLGLVIAGLTDRARRQTRLGMTSDTTAVVLVSIYEDIAVLIGTLLFVLVPLIGALLAFLLLLFFYRVERRSRRKHKGLRILRG